MTPEDLKEIQTFFDQYSHSFIEDHKDNQPYVLKRAHTLRVTQNIEAVGQALGLDDQTRMRARAAGLLHDVGRFPQFRDHGTFVDHLSANHAALGVETLKAKGVLDRLPGADRDAVLSAVGVHNAYALPENMPRDHALLTRLLRDGDKLDILKVMADKYTRDQAGGVNGDSDAFITMCLPHRETVSLELIRTLRRGRMLDRDQVNCLNDLKLLQVSWVFDLNFAPSYDLLGKRGPMATILSTLPRVPEILSLEKWILEEIAKRARPNR